MTTTAGETAPATPFDGRDGTGPRAAAAASDWRSAARWQPGRMPASPSAGRRREVVEAAAADLRAGGFDCVGLSGDVSSAEGAGKMVGEAVSGLRGLDILVNCAGVYRAGPLAAGSDENEPDPIDLVVDVDLKGVLFATRAAIPPSPRRPRRRFDHQHLVVAHSIAARQLLRLHRREGRRRRVDPQPRGRARRRPDPRQRGASRRRAHRRSSRRSCRPRRSPAFLDGFGDEVPLGRVGEPDDVARAVVFLCDPANDWITGALLTVDGGLSLGTHVAFARLPVRRRPSGRHPGAFPHEHGNPSRPPPDQPRLLQPPRGRLRPHPPPRRLAGLATRRGDRGSGLGQSATRPRSRLRQRPLRSLPGTQPRSPRPPAVLVHSASISAPI